MLKKLYNIIQSISNRLGFHLVIVRAKDSRKSYEPIVPKATYAPWKEDIYFNQTFQKIKEYTLLDKYRLYELWELTAQSAKLSGAILEVGAWRGGSAAMIAVCANKVGIKDMIYVCDTFEGVVKVSSKDAGYRGGEHANTSLYTVEYLLSTLKVPNFKILKGIFPEQTANAIKESKFRFCHIDVDTYQSAKDTTEWIWPKLVQGGVIVYDDYGFQGCNGVTTFINEERTKPDRIIIHNLNGHAIMIKLPLPAK